MRSVRVWEDSVKTGLKATGREDVGSIKGGEFDTQIVLTCTNTKLLLLDYIGLCLQCFQC